MMMNGANFLQQTQKFSKLFKSDTDFYNLTRSFYIWLSQDLQYLLDLGSKFFPLCSLSRCGIRRGEHHGVVQWITMVCLHHSSSVFFLFPGLRIFFFQRKDLKVHSRVMHFHALPAVLCIEPGSDSTRLWGSLFWVQARERDKPLKSTYFIRFEKIIAYRNVSNLLNHCIYKNCNHL